MSKRQESAISSQGHHGSAAGWLDAHFQTAEPEYTRVAHAAGFQMGWHVLDAGCGSGSFLPILAEQVGTTGRLTALDMAPENITTVRDRVQQWGFPVPFEAHTGSVTALPFDDNSFDGLWCANVTLYLSDDELEQAMTEFRRVVKPGGIVAIKDVDLSFTRLHPASYEFFWHFLEAAQGISVHVHGALRSQTLKRRLEGAEFESVRQHTTLIERWAPLLPVERQYIGGILAFFAEYAVQTDLSDQDANLWRGFQFPDSSDSLLNQPDFYWCEAAVLAVGHVQK
jgi:arsenite methyltransferase